MPRGYYLAQGLYPLGEHSSDDEEGPCELPNGRLVCGPHGLVICGKCCTDYSFMDDILGDTRMDEDDEDDEDDEVDDDPYLNELLPRDHADPGCEKRRGTGQVIPTKFAPQGSISPTELFRGQKIHVKLSRYIHPSDPKMVLIITDGACLNNGQSNPKAGWAFVQGLHESEPAIVSGRLENRGPFGDESIQSSNRAELRAVIAALRFRYWPGEGFKTMTIATDSEYVVEGSTKWVRSWVRRGWKTAGNVDVKNKDLWEILLGEFERWKDEGLSIQFWKIPREWNATADAAAKKAASGDAVSEEWMDVLGLLF
ncbi:Fc.00g026450.m01.CDS01 [Cosmosporella sp. VM-42]